MSDAPAPNNICVTVMVHPAEKGDELAYLGQMVFAPLSDETLLPVLNAVGAQCERLFPDTFQYAQAVGIAGENEPDHLGAMVVLAPFEDEAAARDYMLNASGIMQAEITSAEMQTHLGSLSVQ